MKAKKFRTLRESTGLTVKWLAEEMNVSQSRVRDWEEGHAEIPAMAIAKVREMGRLGRIVSDRLYQQLTQVDTVTHVILVCYNSDEEYWEFHPDDREYPVTFHNAVLERTKNRLVDAGYGVNMVPMDKERYFAWLGKRKDSSEMRTLWANSKDNIHIGQSVQKAQPKRDRDASTRFLKIKAPKHLKERFTLSTERFNELLEQSGLSHACVAMLEEVPVETVSRWASGEMPIPKDIEERLEYTAEAMEQAIDTAFENISRQLGPSPDEEVLPAVVLPVFGSDEDIQFFRPQAEYFPSASQAVVMGKIARKFSEQGFTVRTVTLTRDAYTQWRGRKKDTQKLRDKWMREVMSVPEENADVPVPVMPPQELVALRESVGLDVEQLAGIAGITARQISGWESGRRKADNDVVALLLKLDSELSFIVEEIRNTMLELEAEGEKPPIFSFPAFEDEKDLWKYFTGFRNFPVSTHKALLGRIEKMLLEIDILPMFYAFDRVAYQKWLGNRKDSLKMLAQWDRFLSTPPDSSLAN